MNKTDTKVKEYIERAKKVIGVYPENQNYDYDTTVLRVAKMIQLEEHFTKKED
jgi:hypothetical protein